MTAKKATKSTRRIANCRTLPEFEEQEFRDDRYWGNIGFYNDWRTVVETRRGSTVSDWYACLDCGGHHTLPGFGKKLIVPTAAV
jgi:hypothetical protein